MRVVIFGATGMIGQGVLRESLLAEDVESVLVVGRAPTGQRHPKLREVVHADFTDLSPIEGDLTGRDACFYCLGVSSGGLSEAEYHRITHDYTLAAAGPLARLNPELTFVYVSGAGSDSTERGRVAWARVKGRTENAILALFPNGYAFRPAVVQPTHGAVSRTRSYRVFYTLTGPFLPVLRRLLPRYVTTTERVGRAMLQVARHGFARRVVENADLNSAGLVGTGRLPAR